MRGLATGLFGELSVHFALSSAGELGFNSGALPLVGGGEGVPLQLCWPSFLGFLCPGCSGGRSVWEVGSAAAPSGLAAFRFRPLSMCLENSS